MRTIGLDLNGVADFAVRDWGVDDDKLRNLNDPVIVEGGAGGVVIKQDDVVWIGGPQAALAPHGRGPGWGQIGDPRRRIKIASLLAAVLGDVSGREDVAFCAAARALTRQADSIVQVVPDLPDIDEGARSRVLQALTGLRMRKMSLLWRPVALFLHLLETNRVTSTDIEGRFVFLMHTVRGIEVQVLRLREDSEHPGHLAPERESYGRFFLPELGLALLEQCVSDAVISANPSILDQGCEEHRLGFPLLCGQVAAGERRVLRMNNGNWLEIRAPKIKPVDLVPRLDLSTFSSFLEDIRRMRGCFLWTPLGSDWVATLVNSLQPLATGIQVIEPFAAAHGALIAGRYVERGLPHYFDRLTPISLAVLKNREPEFVDLIESNQTLPANKEYVSSPYRGLSWGRGKKEMNFYILKGDTEVRFWQVQLESAPLEDTRVELRLRQTPGQSWAKLFLTSTDWDILERSPISLDWERLKPLDESAQEVLDRLRKPPPTIPTRIAERADIAFWLGSQSIAGMLPILSKGKVLPSRLANLLRRSSRVFDEGSKTYSKVWTIGTDGELPESTFPFDSVLDETMAPLARAVLGAAKSGRALKGNDELRALTWMFTRCPDEVQEVIVLALEEDLSGGRHALLTPMAARSVLIQGAGRVVAQSDRIRRVLEVLTSVHPFAADRRANNNTFIALAMLLSRRKEAPGALDTVLVERIARIVADELESIAQSNSSRRFGIRFKNAMLALAGLFRYREVEPFALLRGESPTAFRLSETLEKIRDCLIETKIRVQQADVKEALVADLLKHLEGEGDADILRRIEDSEDENVQLDEESR